jgi:hypothetical protein
VLARASSSLLLIYAVIIIVILKWRFYIILHGLKEIGLNILRLDSPHPNPIKGYLGCRTTEVTGSSPQSRSFETAED